ncbi:uncharacterized protein LOC111248015 [Varroa destructor]|uniref:Uncharacterized protein n=1 Tax=Varroa destructor TaxID=109461 RepID=A0A7M7JSD1_VARDE|nr:uncharacterized protein LOC111248015 [Varroa destructor]
MHFSWSRLWSGAAGSIFGGMILLNVAAMAAVRESCEGRMHNCTERVRPFLHDLEYMFPTNLQHIDNMCRMWGGFVDCIRLYVKDCASDDQRSRFNDAVGDSIDTVHAICASDKYQKEYLQSASCFRKVSVDNCGSHYNDMVGEVSQSGSEASDNICCSYSKFRSCVSEPLLRLCGSHARTIMDHSMAFLIHRCSGNSYSLSYECPKSRGHSIFTNDRPIVVSSSMSLNGSPIVDDNKMYNNDIRHRHSTFRSTNDPRNRDDYYDRYNFDSREIARQSHLTPASAGASGASYRLSNQYNNRALSDHNSSSSAFAASPTLTSSATDFGDSNQDTARRLQATAKFERPAASASSRLSRTFSDNDSSTAVAQIGGGHLLIISCSLLILTLF